jgi:hypothetical protein
MCQTEVGFTMTLAQKMGCEVEAKTDLLRNKLKLTLPFDLIVTRALPNGCVTVSKFVKNYSI